MILRDWREDDAMKAKRIFKSRNWKMVRIKDFQMDLIRGGG